MRSHSVDFANCIRFILQLTFGCVSSLNGRAPAELKDDEKAIESMQNQNVSEKITVIQLSTQRPVAFVTYLYRCSFLF